MSKTVIVDGDVIATAGTAPYPPAASGSWTPGSVVFTKHNKLSVNGVKVVYQAKCTFNFSGQTSDSPPKVVTASEEVLLKATSTKLMEGGVDVLLHGDKKVGAYGNTLEAKASRQLLRSD